MSVESRRIAIGMIVLALQVSAAASVNRALVFGGNCEEGKSNRFSSRIASVDAALNRSGWQVQSLFDGNDGWSDERALIAKATDPKQPVGSATKEGLFARLDAAAADSALGSGSQFLMHILTHGRQTAGGVVHEICMADGPMRIDDPGLLTRLQRLKDKGVRLGFIDTSCYSGATVPVLGKFGCVVTSQTANRASIDGFTPDQTLIELLSKPPKERSKLSLDGSADGTISLETVFLRSLASLNKTKLEFGVQPLISTDPTGNSAAEASALLYGRPFETLDNLSANPACANIDPTSELKALLNGPAATIQAINDDHAGRLLKDYMEVSELSENLRKKYGVVYPPQSLGPRLNAALKQDYETAVARQARWDEAKKLIGDILARMPPNQRNSLSALKSYLNRLHDFRNSPSENEAGIPQELLAPLKRLDALSEKDVPVDLDKSAEIMTKVSQLRFRKYVAERKSDNNCARFILAK